MAAIVIALVSCLFVSTLFAPAAGAFQCINTSPCWLACSTTCSDGNNIFSPSYLASRTRAPAAAAVEQSQQSVILTPKGSTMNMEAVISRVVAVAEHKLAASTQKLAPHQYPTATLLHNGQWMFNNAGHWTSGFFVGCLWQLHALTGKPEWSAAAQRWQGGLTDKQRTWQSQHDFGEQQRLQLTVGAGSSTHS